MTCRSAASCWAVGSYARERKLLALHWDGKRWSRVATPNPGRKYEEALETVSCPSSKSCWAFGYYYAAPLKPTVTGYLVALHWNGAKWQVAWKSSPFYGADASATLGIDVSCTSAKACWAAGYSSRSPLDYHPILLRWAGGTWEAVKAPRFKAASLDSVTCSSKANCWAVGNIGTFFGGTHALILHWRGSRWVRMSSPRNTGSLGDVSCGAISSCWAVGAAGSDSNANLAERWNGRVWSAL